MLNSLVIGHNRNVIFASVNIPNQSNEDRASSLLSHDATAAPGKDIMSFAIMDGHNGVSMIWMDDVDGMLWCE
jgi:hypothetical protein